PKSYSSSILFVPAEAERSGGIDGGGLSSIASMAGLGGGNTSANQATIHLETLKSRRFIKIFFLDEGYIQELAPMLWDKKNNRLKNNFSLTDLHAFMFQEHLSFSEDRRKKIYVLSVKSKNPDLSAKIANSYIRLGNQIIREKLLLENDAIFQALSDNSQTNILSLRQGVSQKLLSKLFESLLARSKEDYAFNIIDPAVPDSNALPAKRVMAMFSLAFSLVIIILIRLILFQKKILPSLNKDT
ncbi:hypothetical protein OAC69_04740, partial [Gammaproteobacteria bacterium]|nr:hypothetical protein [Gammaproteobacteria bacterium]